MVCGNFDVLIRSCLLLEGRLLYNGFSESPAHSLAAKDICKWSYYHGSSSGTWQTSWPIADLVAHTRAMVTSTTLKLYELPFDWILQA